MSDSTLRPLRSELANPILRFLQAVTNDADGIDRNLRMTNHEVQQLGLAPTCFERLHHGSGVGRIMTIGEKRDGAEHLAGTDEADHHLGAVTPGLGDTHASLDYRMSANIVIALVEDARSCRYPSLTRHGSRNLQGRRRQSQKQIRGCKRLRGYLRVDNHRTTLARKLARCEKFALAQTFGLSSAVGSHDVRRGKGPMELGIFGGKAVDRVTALLTISARQP